MNREFLGAPDMHGGKAMLSNQEEVDTSLAGRLLSASLAAIQRFLDNASADEAKSSLEGGPANAPASSEQYAAGLFCALSELIPSFDLYDKTDALAARNMLERLRLRLDPVDRGHMYVYYDNGDTPEGLIEEADASADEKTKNELYETAAWLAVDKKSIDEVLAIAQKITNADESVRLQDRLIEAVILKLGDKKQYEAARELLGRLRSSELRVGALFALSFKAKSVDKVLGLQFLDQAGALLSGEGNAGTVPRAAMLMNIARSAALIDPARSLAHVRASIKLINASAGLPVPADALTRYIGVWWASDPLSLYGPALEVFTALSGVDYFGALGLAQSLEDRVLSVTAQLAVIRTRLQ
jgi:hypothetical protein